MTPVIAGSINRTPTGSHRRCVMFKSLLYKGCYFTGLGGLLRICSTCSINLWNNAIDPVKMHNCSLFTDS